MTYKDAIQLLDRVREGQQFPEEVVAAALAITEDKARREPPSAEITEFVQALRQSGVL